MACEENINSPWASQLDFEVRYTGETIGCEELTIEQGENLRSIITKLTDRCCELQGEIDSLQDEIDNFDPVFIVNDSSVNLNTTGVQLNALYPQAPLLGVVYNSSLNISFTKYPTGWKFEVIEIR